MKLSWRLFKNPIADSDSPLWLDLDHVELQVAKFSTFAQGGFGDGQLVIKNPSDNLIQDLIDNGLMKRVTATDGAGNIAYEGFIGEIHAIMNHQTLLRSMDDFANRVIVRYQYTGGNCSKGATCGGQSVRNEYDILGTDTQTQLGIKERWYNITRKGKTATSSALAMANIFLNAGLRAQSTQFQLGDGTDRPNAINLVLWGYYATLQWQAQKLKIRTDTEIANIVRSAMTTKTNPSALYTQPAQFINTDEDENIEDTGVDIKFNREGNYMPLQDYIQSVIQEGNSNGYECSFQIWEERKPYLYARPSVAKYYSNYDHSLIYNNKRRPIPLYMVRAGGFVRYENLNETTDPIADIRKFKRAALVYATTYDDLKETLTITPPDELVTPDTATIRGMRQLKHKNT